MILNHFPYVNRFSKIISCRLEKSLYTYGMVKIDLDDLLTVTQAAEVRNVTRQAINHLIREGKLPVVEIAGKRFVKRSDVMSFEPDKGGRPAQASKKGKGK